ncbi:MAG: hypothetical protein O2958_12345 [Gemmatimonadetes bacterium]|nr:hypothetical protein [Gemmatimonadota bacterium]
MNSGWVEVGGENNVYEMTVSCGVGATAMSVGVNGVGAMNNVIAMAITGGSNNQGYFRVRITAGSQPSEVWRSLRAGRSTSCPRHTAASGARSPLWGRALCRWEPFLA